MVSNPRFHVRKRIVLLTGISILILALGMLILQSVNAPIANAQVANCVLVADPREIPNPKIITFDDLKDNAIIGTHYQAGYGAIFPSGTNSVPTIHAVSADGPDFPHTPPNVVRNIYSPVAVKSPLEIDFTFPRGYVGMYLGNGDLRLSATLSAYDAKNILLCQFPIQGVPVAHILFVGIYDNLERISKVTLAYPQSTNQESIDNLYLSPGLNPTPRRALPTWTPVPTAVPTAGPAPTATSPVPMYSFKKYNVPQVVVPLLSQPDFAISGIEITEGIQCFNGKPIGCADNSLPLVLNKDATARIYLKANNADSNYNNVPVRLHILAFGNDYTANSTGNPKSTINQAVKDSADVYFNAFSGSPATIQFYAVVDPDNIYAETNETNNRYPAVGNIVMNFDNRRSMTVVGSRLQYHPSGYTGSQFAGGWAVNGGAAQWWNQLLPLKNNAINSYLRSGYLNWTTSLGSGDGQHSLISALNWSWLQENAFSFLFGTGSFTGARHVYGWAPSAGYSGGHADMPIYPHAGGFGVVGIGSDAAGTSSDNPGSGALIFGHELTHDYNIYHTDTPDACGSNDSNSNFPYSNSSIQAFGFNTITGKIYDPALTHDLMSYCPSGGSKQGWISPFTWSAMFAKLSPTALNPVSGSAPAIGAELQPYTFTPTIATQSLVVNATIYNPADLPVVGGKLGNLERISAGLSYTVPAGEYVVELHSAPDGGGTLLASQSFTADFESEYHASTGTLPAPPFPATPTHEQTISFIMPWADGTRSITLTHLGQVFDTKNVSQNAPQVTITSPVSPVSWPAHTTQSLTWNGTDLDGDALVYSVYFSNDGGTSWSLVADSLTDPSYAVNVDAMSGGSDVRFRVVVTDGVNAGFDETTQTITIPNHAPEAIISDPAGLSFHLPGDLIVFHGMASDMEDGSLPDSALKWSDNIQGSLGSGPSVPINHLTPGKHTISLTATDSYGISTTASVTIFVDYPVYLPSLQR